MVVASEAAEATEVPGGAKTGTSTVATPLAFVTAVASEPPSENLTVSPGSGEAPAVSVAVSVRLRSRSCPTPAWSAPATWT